MYRYASHFGGEWWSENSLRRLFTRPWNENTSGVDVLVMDVFASMYYAISKSGATLCAKNKFNILKDKYALFTYNSWGLLVRYGLNVLETSKDSRKTVMQRTIQNTKYRPEICFR